MCGYFPKKFNPTILHWHRLVQSLGYRFGNQGFFVLLQKSNLFFQICGNAVNLGTFFVEKIGDSLLFCCIREGITKFGKIILIQVNNGAITSIFKSKPSPKFFRQ